MLSTGEIMLIKKNLLINDYPAMMAQWLGSRTRNHKVVSLSPITAVVIGDWFTQP